MGIRPTLLLCTVSGLIAYIGLAGPTFYWLDSSEFVAASWTLGIAHAPGHPLAALLGRLFCLLPFGTIAFRVTLACATQAAAAVAISGLISHRLVDAVTGEDARARLSEARPWHHHLAVICATLTLSWSYALAFQAVRAEVYALNLLCVLGAAYLLLRAGQLADRRYLLASAFAAGLGLCNHHLLVILALPGAGLYLALGGRPRAGWRRAVVGLVAAGLLALCTLAYLPLRARTDPRVNWGAPTTVSRFAWVVSARSFHKSFDRAARETLSHRAGGAAFAVLGGLGPLAAVAAAGGLYLAWRRRGSRRAAALLTAIGVANLASPLLVGFDPFNPDAHGYLVVAVAAFAPGIAVLVAALGRALSQHARRLAPLLLVFLALPALQLRGLPRADLGEHWAAEETGRAVLDQPERALLLTSYFSTIFNVWALQSVWDLRPDVTVVHRNFLAQPGYAAALARRHPRFAAELARWGARGRVRVADLDALAERRPVRVEHDLNVRPAIAAKLRLAGLVAAYVGRRSLPSGEHRRRVSAWLDAVGPVRENETRRALAWINYLQARLACRHGDHAAFRFHVGVLRKLAPRSRSLAWLIRRCR